MATRAKLLVVDDEPVKRAILEERLKQAGFAVDACDSPLAAERLLAERGYDVVITDIRMPGQDGMSFLRELKARDPAQAVILTTAYGSVGSAVEAMKLGAYDYIQKPFDAEELVLKLDRLVRYEGALSENEALRRQLRAPEVGGSFVGGSSAIHEILAKVHTLSGVDSTVLIQGESGTGKECLARLIHDTSHRRGGPFLAVGCASLPRELIETELFGHEAGAFTGAVRRRQGRFELAHGGTLFLDDVDDIPVEVQGKLLRVLQERAFERIGGETTISVNFRLVAATKKNILGLVERGLFRQDLFYRIHVVPLFLPALRERSGDIPLLVNHFVQRHCVKLNRPDAHLAPEAMGILATYSWPGNVRELENLIERLLVLTPGDTITADQLPEEVRGQRKGLVAVDTTHIGQIDLSEVLADVEDQLVRWALAKAENNLVRASALLGIPRSTLQYKIARLSGEKKQKP